MRVRAWLLAAIVINLAATIGIFIADEYGDGRFPVPFRGVLLLINFACLVVFGVKWWRWREVDRARPESGNQ